MALHAETPVTVTLTMKSIYLILAGFLALLGAITAGVWGITTSTVSDIRHDVGEIRSGLAANVDKTNQINLDLTKEISGLRVTLAALGPKIDNLNATVTKFEVQLASLQNPLADPKTAQTFVENLNKAGVLITPAPLPPTPESPK
jgi:hypothetical protein